MAASKPFWPPFDLASGYAIPAIGFGIPDGYDEDTIVKMINYALKAGYRSFDTSAQSSNNIHVGEALRTYLPQHDLNRDDIFITTKLNNAHHVKFCFEKLEAALHYTPDLYVLQFPSGYRFLNKKEKSEAWKAVSGLYDSGRVMSIGLSNCSIANLKTLVKEFHCDAPVLNQVTWNVLSHDEALLSYCNENSILLQGDESLGGTDKNELLRHPIIKDIADDNAATAAQVLLTWSLERGVVVVPKSKNAQHITENINLNFHLSADEMNILNQFDSEVLTMNRLHYKQKKFLRHRY